MKVNELIASILQSIQSLPIANELATLPLVTLQKLLLETPVHSRDGVELRQIACNNSIVDIVLKYVSKNTHTNGEKDITTENSLNVKKNESQNQNGDKIIKQSYWAKGTGFGTGSTASSWNIEKAISEKIKEEEELVIIFQILSAFIEAEESPSEYEGDIATIMKETELSISKSNIMETIVNYLHNDSVLDMSRHIPLYKSLLSLLKSFASCKHTIRLIIGMYGQTITEKSSTVLALLTKLKDCVQTYQDKLRFPKKVKLVSRNESAKSKLKAIKEDKILEAKESDSEELNSLLTYIHTVYEFVAAKVEEYKVELDTAKEFDEQSNDLSNSTCSGGQDKETVEEIYINDMMDLQFDTYEIITENEDGTYVFNVPYHYANTVRTAAKNNDFGNPSRTRRLTQEVALLSTSLPISYSSTVFLKCDEERLDVMKVLITGPEDTPYENGCFEFDIYFPQDYPQTPMSVNLQTTGRNTVRFNPNLYNDGKVCLSILNTWHGRPEERWNAQTSNLLQVLVSIQSLILVCDPYFNEPGYERLRDTPQGKQSSTDYNANIQQATVKWAMLEQIRRPSGCFKEIIVKHFLMKKKKILPQIDRWIKELEEQVAKRKSISHSYESLKTSYNEMKVEFAKLEKDNSTADGSQQSESTTLEEETSLRDTATDSYTVTEAVYL